MEKLICPECGSDKIIETKEHLKCLCCGYCVYLYDYANSYDITGGERI